VFSSADALAVGIARCVSQSPRSMISSLVESGPLRSATRLHRIGGVFQVDVELAVSIGVSAETQVAVELSEVVREWSGSVVLRKS
jgi:hypothetical protein